ncbi:MAG TPA: branched-chain amino acid ABC transporter permease [Solirubrobacterales bacterium]|nr:branched-chain amino acid ABC transporter permease [Solirubrobacterales bacterium]
MFNYILDLLVLASIFAVVAVGLNLQAGVSGLPNFGIVLFFGIGAYGAGLATKASLPWTVGLLGAVLVATAAALLLGRLSGSLPGTYWGIATLAIAEAVRVILFNQDSVFGGAQGIGGVSLPFASLPERTRLILCLLVMIAILAVCLAISQRLIGTQFGRALRLQREQPELAASLGHDLIGVRTAILIISGAMAAAAGVFYAHYIAYTGTSELEMATTITVWTMVVVGGIGNSYGVVLGALLIQTLYSTSRFLGEALNLSADRTASLRIMLIGFALFGFLMLKNDGLLPERLRKIRA